MIVYIAIGNSDDKLRQQEWAAFVRKVRRAITFTDITIHGQWFSPPDSVYQNACFCIEFSEDAAFVDDVKENLRKIAAEYKQDSIAWTEAPFTELLTARKEAD